LDQIRTQHREPRELIEKGNKEICKFEVEELTIEDVKKAIRNLKNNKAAELMEYYRN
jgi:hypothetical protein